MVACHRRLHLRLVLTFIVALPAWPSCNRKEGASRGVVVVARARDVTTLDPAVATDVDSADVISQIYETLVTYGARTVEIKPGLAVRWTKSTDLKTWTFYLRRGVTFHDGTPFDADAVVFSFNRQAQGGPHFDYWNSSFANIIQKVERIERHVIRITLTQPFAPFLASLAMFPVSIMSPAAVKRGGQSFLSHPVGTGPFRFVNWDRKTGTITLEAFNKYWGGPPRIGRVLFRRIRDGRQRLRALESGAVHIIRDLDPGSIQMVRLHPDLKLMVQRGNNVAYLAFNCNRYPFNNPYARWSVNRAIRKKVLVKLIYQGLAEQAVGPLPPVMAWAYTSNVTTYPHDLLAARQDLKASGFSSDLTERVKLFVMDSPRLYLPRPLLAAQMIVRDLAEIGMHVQLVIQPFKEHVESMKNGEHHLALYGWVGDNGDPDNFLYTLLYPRSPLNVAFWQNTSFAQLVEAGRQTRDEKGRALHYKKAQKIAADQSPWVPLAHTKMVAALRREVKNLVLTASALMSLHQVELR